MKKQTITERAVERALVVNDFHCGSAYGMLPPDMMDAEDNHVHQNAGQEHLWNEYIAAVKRLEPTPPDYIIVNGDMHDGEQRKSNGETLCLHRLSDQREAAYKCLRILQRAFPNAHWEFITGTRYHEARCEVEILARDLNGGVKRPVHRNLFWDINGALLDINHEIPGLGDLKGNAIEKEITRAHVAASEHGWELPDILVRAHLHCYRQMQRNTVIGVIAPCMELQTEFMNRKSRTAMIPDLGMLLLTIERDRRARGLNPVIVDRITCEYPTPEIMVLTEAAAVTAGEKYTEHVASWRPSKLTVPVPQERRVSAFKASLTPKVTEAPQRRVSKFVPSK